MSAGAYKGASAWMFECYSGNCYNAGKSVQNLIDVKSGGGNRVGDVIGVEVNMNTRTLQFYVNGAAAGPQTAIALDAQQAAHLVPAVDLYWENSSVEFVL